VGDGKDTLFWLEGGVLKCRYNSFFFFFILLTTKWGIMFNMFSLGWGRVMGLENDGRGC